MYKGIAIGGVVLCMVGCAANPETSPAPWHEIEMSFEPVGRLVNTHYRFNFRVDTIETEDGLVYIHNDEFRAPDSPVGPLPVDCDETKQIGVLLIPQPYEKKRSLYRSVVIDARVPKVEVSWAHSERREGDSRYYWRVPVNFGSRFISRLKLSKEDRIDGVMTLKIHRADEVLYETSFQLMGCGLR